MPGQLYLQTWVKAAQAVVTSLIDKQFSQGAVLFLRVATRSSRVHYRSTSVGSHRVLSSTSTLIQPTISTRLVACFRPRQR